MPDTIQSLAVAKKGYGSLAVANCLGAQVANIGFGLGLPWFLSALWGQQVVLAGHAEVQTLVPHRQEASERKRKRSKPSTTRAV